jgi:hypothetical protein
MGYVSGKNDMPRRAGLPEPDPALSDIQPEGVGGGALVFIITIIAGLICYWIFL